MREGLISRDRAGFTIIELLVSVSIVGVLAAIALPNFKYAQTQSHNATARSDYANFKTAVYGEIGDVDENTLNYYYYYSNGNGTGQYWSYDGSSWTSGSFSLDGNFPGPLNHMSVSNGSIPRIVYSYQYNKVRYRYIWMDHEKSSESYRIIDYSTPFFTTYTGDTVIQK